MAEYLLSGRDADGRKQTERVDADSADKAMQIFLSRGYEDVVLHTDDVSALYTEQSAVDEVISPRQFLWFRVLPAPFAGALLVTIKSYEHGLAWHIGELLLLGYRRYAGMSWGFIDYALVFFLLLPLIWGIGAQFFRGTAEKYTEFIEAGAWGRWDEVLRRAEGLRGKIPPEECAFRKASALAALGRLTEALDEVEPFGDGEAIPEWLYWSRLPEVYIQANEKDLALECLETALELAPENATVLLDLAKTKVFSHHDPQSARELLRRARQHSLSDVLIPIATYTEGLILFEEGKPRESLPLQLEGFEGMAVFKHASPLIGLVLDYMHASISMAYAGAGDTESALRHFKLARPRLEALGRVELLERCRKALGPAASS